MKLHLFPQYQLQSSLKDNSSWWVSSQIQSILDISKFQQWEIIQNIESYTTFLRPYNRIGALEWLQENTCFWIGKLLQVHLDRWFIEWEYGFAEFDFFTGEILLNTWNLGIWKIIRNCWNGIYHWEYWVVKIDFKSCELIYTTGNLWKWEIHNVWTDGFISFKGKGWIEIDLSTWEIKTK